MIVLYHSHSRVVDAKGVSGFEGKPMPRALLEVAKLFPEETIVWCDSRLRDFANLDRIPELMHHKRIMASYSTVPDLYLPALIGYCEEASPFIPVKRDVKYPTFRMSAQIGMVHAQAVNAFSEYLYASDSFEYLLNSFAKLAMGTGLLCYSEPALLKPGYPELKQSKIGTFGLFRFVRHHYRMRWTWLLFMAMVFFEKRFPLLPYLFSLFASRRKASANALASVPVQSSKKIAETNDLHVILPTIGRKEHAHNVIRDLSVQTLLPKKVIVVEQNPDPSSVSELDFLQNGQWPFQIEHIFTHRPGACAARNEALMRTSSEFVLMADDDIRFDPDMVEKALRYMRLTGNEVLQVAGPQPHEKIKETQIVQYAALGSGWVFLKQECLQGVSFDPGFEFGYGEDKDFGMQLRNKGYDVLLCPFVQVSHLKAPMGGFRTKPVLLWSADKISPKPSPTIMLYMIKNMLPEQVRMYKTVLFLKAYAKKGLNVFKAYRNFERQWERSVYWANELRKR